MTIDDELNHALVMALRELGLDCTCELVGLLYGCCRVHRRKPRCEDIVKAFNEGQR